MLRRDAEWIHCGSREMNYLTPVVWVEGEQEKSFWAGIKTSGRAQFNVRAMRCEKCGFLEFYADKAGL